MGKMSRLNIEQVGKSTTEEFYKVGGYLKDIHDKLNKEERRKEYNRKYYIDNRDKIHEAQREYYQNNKEKIKAASKEYRANNKKKLKGEK